MKKKRGILYWLKVIVAIFMIFILMYRCSHNYGLTAHAEGPSSHPDSTHAVTLTPAQTLALFGTEIQGILYPTQNGSPVTITFDYAFPLSSIGYMDSGGGFDTDVAYQNIWSTYSNRQSVAEYLGESNGLVYVASSSQWGGVDTSPYGASQTVQLHCPFSIDLSDITGIRQDVLYSTASGSLSYWEFNSTGNIMTVLSDPNYSMGAILSNAQRNGIRRATYISMPTYPYYSSSGSVDETALQYFTLFQNFYQSDSSFNIRGFTIDCYNVTNGSSGTDLWVILTCPTLYNYNPPPETTVATTRPAETIPVATYPVETMPPAYTDTPQNILNQNLITNNYQLNLIIGQLNLIYAKLCAEGELGLDVDLGWHPDLQDGENLPYYDTDIQSQMYDIINGHTTATVPNFDTSFVKDGYDFLTDNAWIAKMGALSLALSVAAWIIFRGRGG